jgi:hypothetical protein
MLDWDKPLSQQAESVRVAAADLGLPRNATGAQVYQALANQARDVAILRGFGIPGIRYLDGGSRGAGQGSSNFVLFDDNMPRILEINGVPTGLKPWADDMPRKK